MATSGGLIAETKLVAPALLGRVGGPVLYMVSNATRYGGPVIDKARKSTSNVAWLLTRKYGFGTRKPSPSLVSYVETMNSRTSADTVTRYLRTLATHSRFPALARAGGDSGAGGGRRQGHDHAGRPHSEEIVRRLPHAEFVKIKDSGHVVMLEHADEVNAALARFLESLQSWRNGESRRQAADRRGHSSVRPAAGRAAARRRPGAARPARWAPARPR